MAEDTRHIITLVESFDQFGGQPVYHASGRY
jgi:hypothetical protein